MLALFKTLNTENLANLFCAMLDNLIYDEVRSSLHSVYVCVLYKCNLHPYSDNCATNNPGYVSSHKNVLCLVSGQQRRVAAAERDKCLEVTM